MKIGIYIPGLSYGLERLTLSNYVQSFARSLDKNDENKHYEYEVKLDKKVFVHGGKQHEHNVATVSRKLPDQQKAEDLYRFYEYNYEESFTEKLGNTNIFRKSVRMFWGIFKMFPVFIITFLKPGQSLRQKLRSFYFFFVLVLISLAVALLLPSLVTMLVDNIPGLKLMAKNTIRDHHWVQGLASGYKHFSHWLVVITSSMAILSPRFQNLVTVASTEYLCVHYYLKYGEGKQSLSGNLSALIENVSETEADYSAFELHAYSFGSVVAIDTLFPGFPQQTDLRVAKEITHFVSVGCPVDFIRVYYPNYFAKRNTANTSVSNWYNVNCEVDVLSSNFRNDGKLEDGETAHTPGGLPVKNITYEVTPFKNVSWLDYLFLLSFKSHSMYWEIENPEGLSFFTNYINRMKTDKTF